MKTRPGVCLALVLASLLPSLPAQEPVPVVTAPAAVATEAETASQPLLNAPQLDQLLGPIALYPDALIALILPAATEPVDVVLAARYLKDGGDPAAAQSRAWADSVKALAHYPDVLKWMDDNLPWTRQLGEAFRAQPDDVMQAVQRLRARARTNGALADTPQQVVVPEDDYIRIVPAQADVIYVPRYEPAVVFVERPVYYTSPRLTFGIGFPVGAWLTYDCNWRQRQVWVVDRRWTWREHRDWRRPVFPGQPGYVNLPGRHPWRPLETAPRPPLVTYASGRLELAPPTPVRTAAPPRPENRARPTPPAAERNRTVPFDATTVVSGSYAAARPPSPAPAPQPAATVAAPSAPPRERPANREWRPHNPENVASIARPAPTFVGPQATTPQAVHPRPTIAMPSSPAAAPTVPAPAFAPSRVAPATPPAPAPAAQPPPGRARDDRDKQAN
jgi:hypothetical protein